MRCPIATIIGVLAIVMFAATSTMVLAATDTAIVTLVDGKADAYDQGRTTGLRLRKNDRVRKGQEIKVSGEARLELLYPDGTVMRVGENSVVTVDDIIYNKVTESKQIRIYLTTGKLWAKTKRILTVASKIEVKTMNAVIFARGTIYQVNMNEDNSALIRVYEGSVHIDSVVQPDEEIEMRMQEQLPAGARLLEDPRVWAVILKSFKQVTISPQGEPLTTQDFNPQQDLDDWVKWNQERDRQLDF